MTDYLAELSVQEVAAWYKRLADSISEKKINGQEPLASLFLKTWLSNRSAKYTLVFHSPLYLKNSDYVKQTLRFHRAVFLTEEKARFTGGRRAWAGVIPRLQGLQGFKKWPLSTALTMEYESLVEVGSGLAEIIRIQTRGTPAEMDLLTSLRGFQLKSIVTVNGSQLSNGMVKIEFKNWQCEVIDKYDFDYNEYFTPPNPDFGKTQMKGAVRPQDRSFRVYHKNAKRLEGASLACPYHIRSYRWQVIDVGITCTAEIDPSKKIN